MHRAIRAFALVAGIVLASVAAFGVDAPDALVNPVSKLIETVDTTWSGSNYNVRYTQLTSGGEQTVSILLTANAANDVDPRIASSASGDVAVVWWRDLATDAVVYRKRSFSTGTWGPEHVAGGSGQSSSHPRVVYSGDKPWVAYQVQNAKNRSIGCQIIDDTPEPITAIVATTPYVGDLDIRLHAESGRLWVTWIDSASYVGYAEYLYDKYYWALPSREPFSTGGVSAALSRIRSRILGL
jgi:hypothetical protein